jgi:hypothetical protein
LRRVRLFRTVLGLVLAMATLGVAGAGTASAKGPCGEQGSCPPGPPKIQGLSASASRHSAKLRASIYPDSYATTYEIWIEYAQCQGGAGECPKPPKKEKVGGGKVSASREAQEISKKVGMLTPSCLYVYWLVAINSKGSVESMHEHITATGGKEGPKACRR